jgi:nucleoside-diphosphate-sugar epimerase
MICLLTGGTGFLGSYISKVISENNVLVSLSRNSVQYSIRLDQKTPVFSEKFDLVIHAAGKAHSVPKSSLEKQVFFDVNLKGTQNLLHGLEESKSLPKAFIFISTVAVYGKVNGVNIFEDAPLLAKDPYGLSKIQAEKLVLDWCKKHDIICTILRLPLLAGQNPPGNLGVMIKGIKGGYYFNIAGGRAKKSMVLAEDVARYILKVAEIGGIYNLTDGNHPSFQELSNHISIQLGRGKPMDMPLWFARIIAKFGDLFGSKAPINSNKLKKITADLTFNDIKAREAFDWNPTSVLDGFKLQN